MHKGVRQEKRVERENISKLDRQHEQTQRATRKPLEPHQVDHKYTHHPDRKGTR